MMGYTSVEKSMFHEGMQQTPENVARVLDIAGWTAEEAGREILYPGMFISQAIEGKLRIPDELWRLLLDVAGRRAFDEGCDE